MINLSSVLKIVRPVVFTINTEDEVLYEINITTSQKNPVSVSDSGECFFDAKVPPSQNYMYINQINSSNVFVSLVCVVKMVFPEKLVKTKNGSEVRKRSIIVTDLNCSDFYINFWGDDCDICYNLEPKQTIAHFWNLRVNEYNNKLDGKYVFETIITIAPKMQAMYELQVKLPLLQQQWANERVGNIEMKPSEIVDYFKLFQFPQLFSYGTRDIYGKTIAVITKIEAEIERSLSYYCNECHMYCASTEYCSECNTTNVSPSLKIYVDLIDESGCLTKIPLRGWVALKFMGIGTKEFENEQLPVEQIKTVMTSSNFLDNISTLHLFKRHCLVFKVFNHKMTVMELEPMNKFEIQERFIAIPVKEP
ncbi:meiosis-specific with OB domain-containing protein-like [Entamoeba marina]